MQEYRIKFVVRSCKGKSTRVAREMQIYAISSLAEDILAYPPMASRLSTAISRRPLVAMETCWATNLPGSTYDLLVTQRCTSGCTTALVQRSCSHNRKNCSDSFCILPILLHTSDPKTSNAIQKKYCDGN